MNRPRNVLLITGALVAGIAAAAFAITGDEILARMESAFSLGGEDAGEGILLSIAVENQYASGVSTDVHLAVVARTVVDEARPDDEDETSQALMYFVGGDDEGMIFLLWTPEAKSDQTRMWLYMSSFGLTKELVSDEDQSGSFAGSTFTYADIAGAGDLRDDYSATIVREETVAVGGEEQPVWVLELTLKPGADADHARMLLWVDQEEDLLLRIEGYDAAGVRTKEIVVERLGSFEERRVPEVMVGHDLDTGDVSTIALSGMRRPDGGLATGTFDPANLDRFDPSAYGF